MTTHAEPFRDIRRLPADLAIGMWLVYGALAGLAWEHARPRLAHTLTELGTRLG